MAILNISQPITTFDAARNLSAGHPVFVIVAEDDKSHLVIKQENTPTASNARQALGHTLKVMKLVSPTTAGSKPLTPAEIQVLRDFCDESEKQAKLFRRIWTEPNDVALLRSYLKLSGPWYKMTKVDGIVSLESAVSQLMNLGRKDGVREIAKALNDRGGFERLGQVVGIDLYNHNTDRFTWVSHGEDNPMAPGQKFKTIGNIGNVMMAIEEGKVKPIGLDSFDPTSDYSDVDETIEQLDKGKKVQDKWGGHWLAPINRQLLKGFAQSIFDDLQSALGKRDRKLAILSKKRLDADGPSRIVKGMEQAAALLRQKLDQMILKPKAAYGLQSRRSALG